MTEEIRVATPEDAPRILALLALRHKEMSAWRGPFNPVLVHHRITQMMRPMTPSIIGIIGPGGDEVRACATIGLSMAQFWDTGLRYLEPIWTFVHPDHRRSDYLKRLIGFAKGASNAMNTPLYGMEEEIPETERKRHFLDRAMQPALSIAIYSHTPREAANG